MHESNWESGREQDGEHLAGALHRAVGGVEPDLVSLVASAASQGRSLRRRRRAGVAGVAAAVLALVVGVSAVQSAGSGQAGTVRAGATGSSAPAASGAPAGPTTLNGKDALTGRDLLFAIAHTLPQGTELGGTTGSDRTYLVAGSDVPVVHAEGYISIPSDGKGGSQYLTASFDSDLDKYLAQQSARTVPSVIGGTPGLDCSEIYTSSQVTCTPSTLPDNSKLRVVTQNKDSLDALSVTYQRPDHAVVFILEVREGSGPARTGVAPEYDVNALKAMAQSSELQAWVSPDFAARAAATVTPYENDDLPRCPLGPGGVVTIMPTVHNPQPGGTSLSPHAPTSPSGTPLASATASPASPSGSPSSCPSGSPSPQHPTGSPLPGAAITTLVPLWPAHS